METNKPLEEQCTEVFRHWLETKKNATWDKLIKGLKSQSVSLPILAGDIEKMLDIPVSCFKGLIYKCICMHGCTHASCNDEFHMFTIILHDYTNQEQIQGFPIGGQQSLKQDQSYK